MSDPTHHATGVSLHGWNREFRWLIAICFLAVLIVAALIFSGLKEAPTPGVTDKEILIGTSLPLEGSIAKIGEGYQVGLETAINSVNLRGGVHGRRITLITRNDGYDAMRCVLNTRDLLAKDHVFALTSFIGTPTCMKAQAIWTGAQVPIVGMYTGAQGVRVPFNRYNFHARVSYKREMELLVKTLVEHYGVKRVALFYQYDMLGLSVRKETLEALSKYQLTLVAEGSYPRNTLDIKSAVDAISAAKPDGVLLAGTYVPVGAFIHEMKQRCNWPIHYAAASFSGGEGLLSVLPPEESEGCLVSQAVPLYSNTQVRIVEDYLHDLHQFFPGKAPSYYSLEGYINGRILLEGIKRAGRSLTREGLISALEDMRGQPLGPGFDLSFSSTNHEGSNRVYLSEIKGGKFVYLEE